LPQDFAKFFSGGYHVTLVARAMPMNGAASVMPAAGDIAGVYQTRDCLSLFVSWLASAP
jgi:hypothetical protein